MEYLVAIISVAVPITLATSLVVLNHYSPRFPNLNLYLFCLNWLAPCVGLTSMVGMIVGHRIIPTNQWAGFMDFCYFIVCALSLIISFSIWVVVCTETDRKSKGEKYQMEGIYLVENGSGRDGGLEYKVLRVTKRPRDFWKCVGFDVQVEWTGSYDSCRNKANLLCGRRKPRFVGKVCN